MLPSLLRLQPPFTVAGIKQLNRIQSRIYKAAMFSNENMLVCAPTGMWFCCAQPVLLARP